MVAGLLALWALLGLAHTAIVLARPTEGVRIRRSEAQELTIGLPDQDRAASVAEARRLLRTLDPRPARVLVVVPDTTEQPDLAYLRFQLATLEYPLRVRVMRAEDPESFVSIERRTDEAIIIATPAGFRLREPTR